jgi:predicted transcriptional regulator
MAYNQNRRFNGSRQRNGYNNRPYRRQTSQKSEEGTQEKVQVRYPGLPKFVQELEPHLVRLIRIVHTNADIRRYTALGIVKRLIDKGVITEEGNYIRFRWDKYTVCSKGINTDYRYTEADFLESYVGAFTILANVAGKALDNFCQIEFDKSAKDAIDENCNDEKNEIIAELIEHQLNSDENIAQFEEKD